MPNLKHPGEAAEGNPAATEALLRFVGLPRPGHEPLVAFDGADLSAFGQRKPEAALRPAFLWLGDVASEWVCDYGESVTRVLRAFLVLLLGFAALYWLSGCLEPREAASTGTIAAVRFQAIDYLLFSLDSMTTVGTSEVALKPSGQLGVLLSSVQTVAGTVLLGLFGFVLGVRMRN